MSINYPVRSTSLLSLVNTVRGSNSSYSAALAGLTRPPPPIPPGFGAVRSWSVDWIELSVF